MSGLVNPKELSLISSAADDAKLSEQRKEREMKAKQKKDLEEAFLSQELHPEVHERLNKAVRRAAEQGLNQIQVLTFPAAFCNDGGRRINILDPEWPASLEGFAKRAYEFYVKELRPLGYKLHCEIISYPDGMPGDVGMFLKW